MNKKDFYEILGVSKSSTQREIKKRFIELVKNNHPDQGGDPEKFKEIVDANEILSDPEKRQMYDQYGHSGFDQNGGFGAGPDMGDFNDIFGSFFGGRAHANQRQPKPKLRPSVEYINVSLKDIYNGGSKTIHYRKQKICVQCKGKGGQNVKKCAPCKGTGIVMKMVQHGPGMYSQSQTQCTQCSGLGEKIDPKDSCKTCHTQKIVEVSESLNVFIERGTPEEFKIKYANQGNEHPSYKTGDLVIVFKSIPHPVFTRKGNDLYCKIKISLFEALTGFKFNLDLLNDSCITIQSVKGEPVKHKDLKMIEGLGLPQFNNPGKFGDLFIEFDVEYPSSISEENSDTLKNILPACLLKNVKDTSKVFTMKNGVERQYDQQNQYDYHDEQEQEPNMGCQTQ
jgi:DnaJ family protein A protein 2